MDIFFSEEAEDTGATPNDFKVPIVSAANPIPVLFGSRFIKAPNVVWYGDVASYPYERCSG